ncbi:hypothetical protein INT48_002769 [Thamnidium elegans]|uniref:Uncharacterized protein n=1 Tax=Thamnidium elegans TaxID=101142 RepID=A0A8H7VS25_9FUNG|nr:hypothetical protein INT48_002769 [Thamnidium elegans]
MTTPKEREMLINSSKCKTKDNIDDLLEEFFKERNLDPMCKHIRLAFATITYLWSIRQLLNINHNESWFCSSSNAPTATLIQQNNFVKDNQRVDFILRNVDDENDYISAEEKPGRKGVKLDLRKGNILQSSMFQLWNRKVNSALIMEQIEAITCQWEGLKLTIYATKYLPNKHLISYTKESFVMPKDETYCASFAVFLAAILSLKRLVFLNYSTEMEMDKELEKY